MFQRRRGLSLALASGILTVSLTGCGQLFQDTLPVEWRANEQSDDAESLARAFASSLRLPVDQVTVDGSTVRILGVADVPMVYDFSQAAMTGRVDVRVGDYRTQIERRELAGTDVAWMAIKLATRMVWGGAKAYFWYWRTHKGDQYVREDAVKAVIYGMLASGVAGLPGGFLWKRLLPIVWKWVVGEEPIKKKTLSEIFTRFMRDVKEIAKIIEESAAL